MAPFIFQRWRAEEETNQMKGSISALHRTSMEQSWARKPVLQSQVSIMLDLETWHRGGMFGMYQMFFFSSLPPFTSVTAWDICACSRINLGYLLLGLALTAALVISERGKKSSKLKLQKDAGWKGKIPIGVLMKEQGIWSVQDTGSSMLKCRWPLFTGLGFHVIAPWSL